MERSDRAGIFKWSGLELPVELVLQEILCFLISPIIINGAITEKEAIKHICDDGIFYIFTAEEQVAILVATFCPTKSRYLAPT